MNFIEKRELIYLHKLTAKEKIEIFLYGYKYTDGLIKRDAKERLYHVQKFSHNYKLELF